MPRIRTCPALALAIVFMLPAAPSQATVSRSYVASYGDDANTAYSCDFAHPCRTFAAALTQTTSGGEILAVDGSGYGPVTIDRSVAIIANPGVFAGIGVFSGSGVTIATAGVSVTLRGLTLNGQGGNYGVYMTGGSRLSIENCVVAGFAASGQGGIVVDTPATVRVLDSIVRDNYNGIWLRAGATSSISRSTLLGNTFSAIYVQGNTAGATTAAAISDTTLAGNHVGAYAYATTASATARVQVIRSSATNGTYGFASEATNGTASLTLSGSMVTGNSFYGLYQGVSGGGASTLKSLGNNTVTDNSTNVVGTVTPVPAL